MKAATAAAARHLAIFLLLIAPIWATACDIAPRTFCETIGLNPDALVVRARVEAYVTNGIQLRVFDVYAGSEANTVINVWDGTDFDCNGPFPMQASQFGAVGDTIAAILPRIATTENPWEQVGDYRASLFWFNTPFLKQNGSQMEGAFDEMFGWQSIPLATFGDMVGECSVSVGAATATPTKAGFEVWPNPASGLLHVEWQGADQSGWLRVSDATGKTVKWVELEKQGSSHVFVGDLPGGLYFLDGRLGSTEIRSRFVVAK